MDSKNEGSESTSDSYSCWLPGYRDLVGRYGVWKSLIEKYDKPGENDEEGVEIDEALNMLEIEDSENVLTAEECLEGPSSEEASEDEEEMKSSGMEMSQAIKKRNAQIQKTGMNFIFNSNFGLSTDFVQQFMENLEQGSGKEGTHEVETRFTEHDGDIKTDGSIKKNLTILNEANRRKICSESTSNYEVVTGDKRRLVIQNIAKTTISSYCTDLPDGSKGTLPMLDIRSLEMNFPGVQPIQDTINEISKTPMKTPKIDPRKGILSNALKTRSCKDLLQDAMDMGSFISAKEVPALTKNTKSNSIKRVHFKPQKRRLNQNIIIELSDDESCESDVASPRKRIVKSSSKDPRNWVDNNATCVDSSKDASFCDKNTTPKKRADASTEKPSSQAGKQTQSHDFDRNYERTPSTSYGGSKLQAKPQTIQPAKEKNLNSSCQNVKPTTSSVPQWVAKSIGPQSNDSILFHNANRYKTEGVIIYRPKPHHQKVSSSASKISIQTKDLDLTGVTSEARRKKFDQFNRLIDPNCTLVYYMTESEDEDEPTVTKPSTTRNDSEESEDDDDPILTFRPKLCVMAYADYSDPVED